MCDNKDCLYYWFQEDELKDKCKECDDQKGEIVHFEDEGMFDTIEDLKEWEKRVKKKKEKLGDKVLACILCEEKFNSNIEGYPSQYATGEGICDSCLESHSKTELLESVW